MNYFILLLGGEGKRASNVIPKQFIKFQNKELFTYPLDVVLENKNINEIILVVNTKYLSLVEKIIEEKYIDKNISIIDGSKTRQLSVFNALKYIKESNKNTKDINVIIHDSVRPLLLSNTVNKLIDALKNNSCITTYIDSFDSVAVSKNKEFINSYLNRDEIINIQTPQAFKFDIIYKAHKTAIEKELKDCKDDASMCNKLLNKKIVLVKGDKLTNKITTDEDLILFDKYLK